MFSLTQGGNYAQFISLLIIMTGYDNGNPETADQIVASGQIVFGFIAYLVAFGVSWFGRFRKGDITPLGFRKY